jgi:hypothetical protein
LELLKPKAFIGCSKLEKVYLSNNIKFYHNESFFEKENMNKIFPEKTEIIFYD